MSAERIPWEKVLKGKGIQAGWTFFKKDPGRLDILQEGRLKGTGTGCPHVPQDEMAGKMIGLAEQGDLAGTQENKEGLAPMEGRGKDREPKYPAIFSRILIV